MTSASSSTEKIKKAGFLPLFFEHSASEVDDYAAVRDTDVLHLPVPVMMVLSSYKNSWEQYSL